MLAHDIPTKHQPVIKERASPDSLSSDNALWSLDIGELTGNNIEVSGREEVNRLLFEGWILLHIYRLTYREDGI